MALYGFRKSTYALLLVSLRAGGITPDSLPSVMMLLGSLINWMSFQAMSLCLLTADMLNVQPPMTVAMPGFWPNSVGMPTAPHTSLPCGQLTPPRAGPSQVAGIQLQATAMAYFWLRSQLFSSGVKICGVKMSPVGPSSPSDDMVWMNWNRSSR